MFSLIDESICLLLIYHSPIYTPESLDCTCFLPVISMVILVSLAASFSPLSSNIYFPALGLIADALHINNSAFLTSVSIYMYVWQPQSFSSFRTSAAKRLPRVAQGLAPSFWGPLADIFGRRQVLIYTMLLYLVACIGLALADNFPVLMVFRFLQAAGSSSTISIGKRLSASVSSLL